MTLALRMIILFQEPWAGVGQIERLSNELYCALLLSFIVPHLCRAKPANSEDKVPR